MEIPGGGGDGADNMKCALCGQFAVFDRTRDPAAVAGFVPSSVIPARVGEVRKSASKKTARIA